jgi:acetylornithine deacetylase/succinyl-diaminopimelate desuccinylase-like protein
MHDVLGAVLEWIPDWQARTSYGGKPGIVNVGSVRGGFPWRVSRTPGRTDLFLDVRVPPTMPMAEARAALADWVRELQGRFPDYGLDWEIYVSAPGAEIAEDHELVRAIDVSHTEVYGSAPDRDTVRWFSDASVLTRYGIATVNYGTSSGLPGADGENLEIRGLVDTARVYALTAQRVCGTT